jgi:hypothetical protein
LGDAADDAEVARAASDAAAGGAALVKIGFAGIADAARATALARAAVRGAEDGRPGAGVIVVGYADGAAVGSVSLAALLDVARAAGARGVLVDTADKSGPGLFGLVGGDALAAWVGEAHAAGLLVALAGRLAAADLPRARATGADVVGVRGAACDGGRGGRVSAERVRALRQLCAEPAPASAGVAEG